MDMELRGVAHGNSRYVAVGSYPNDPADPAKGRTSVALTSGDGMSFVLGKTDGINGFQGSLNDVAFGNGLFATVGAGGSIQTSTDGQVWVSRYTNPTEVFNGVTYGGGRFVAVGNIGLFAQSTDGITWTASNSGSNSSYYGVTYANGQYVAAGVSGGGSSIGTSPDGITWTEVDAGGNRLLSVVYGNGAYVAVDYDGTVARSVNSTTWTTMPLFTSNDLNHVTFGNGQFVAVAFGGLIYTSPDGTVWTERDASTDGFSLNGITHGNGLFVAVGQGALVMTSPNDGGQPPVNPGVFAITGVTLVSCNAISAGQRQLIFSPQYSGLSGQPISFSVANEMMPTTNAGPYTLNMYTDNPVITMKAIQSGTAGEGSFVYNWLVACGLNGARLGANESAEGGLAVRVLGNPVEDGVLSIEVRGAGGQTLSLIVSDMRGQVVGRHGVGQAGSVEEHRFGLGHQPAGLYLLRVSTASQTRTVKVMKR